MDDSRACSLGYALPPINWQRLEDVGFMTAMTLTRLGNYQQTGYFGGPLAGQSP